jgi:uncharacterized membrane protein
VTAGVVTILPIVITLWIIRVVFNLIRESSQWVVEAYLLHTDTGRFLLESWNFNFDQWNRIIRETQERGLSPTSEQFAALLPTYVQWTVPIIAVLLTFGVLYVIGLFTANYFGRRLLNLFEQFVERVPMVKTIYRAIKQILASFSRDQSQNFQRVALIPFPQERMRCVGFITAIFTDSVTKEELATVFIPTTPNPTTGYLQILRRGELTELDWSVEDAVRTIMSGGILRPDFLTIVPTKDMHKYETIPAGVLQPGEKPSLPDTVPPPPDAEPDPRPSQ